MFFCFSSQQKAQQDEAIPKGKKFILGDWFEDLERYLGKIKGGFRKGKGKVKNALIEQQNWQTNVKGKGGGGLG